MTYLLDTNACISHLRYGAQSAITRKLLTLHATDVALCSVVKAESVYGAARSQRLEENRAQLSRFFALFESLAFDDEAAEFYGEIRARLQSQGTPIGPNDLMIASIAARHQLTLVTHNTAEFSRVPNLAVEDWESANSSEEQQ